MITPDEAKKKKKEYLESASWIPKLVIESFDELIVENLRGGTSHFTQDDVIKRIRSKSGAPSRNTLFDKHHLDVEPYYRKAGWKVVFDQPAYCENFEANFTFIAKKSNDD